jgi:hypothetical protein
MTAGPMIMGADDRGHPAYAGTHEHETAALTDLLIGSSGPALTLHAGTGATAGAQRQPLAAGTPRSGGVGVAPASAFALTAGARRRVRRW